MKFNKKKFFILILMILIITFCFLLWSRFLPRAFNGQIPKRSIQMPATTRDNFFAILIIAFLFVYGLWIIIKAVKQIRNPTNINDLGFRWWLDIFFAFLGDNKEGMSEHFSKSEIIRFYAGLTLLAGFFIAFGPLIIGLIIFESLN